MGVTNSPINKNPHGPGEPSKRRTKRMAHKAALARGAIGTPRKRPSAIFDHGGGKMTRDGRKGEAVNQGMKKETP